MPLYEYQCKKCGNRLEKIQKFSDKPLTKCPDCGGPMEKVISAPAVQFKGSGWYVSDYARKGSGAPASDSGTESAPKDSKDSKESKESEDSKEPKKDKTKSDSSHKKHKKD